MANVFKKTPYVNVTTIAVNNNFNRLATGPDLSETPALATAMTSGYSSCYGRIYITQPVSGLGIRD